jgi:hypothetical protein
LKAIVIIQIQGYKTTAVAKKTKQYFINMEIGDDFTLNPPFLHVSQIWAASVQGRPTIF